MQLHSGRQHQIRAHLSGCGHPLLGDVDYGTLPDNVDVFTGSSGSLHQIHLYLITSSSPFS